MLLLLAFGFVVLSQGLEALIGSIPYKKWVVGWRVD
jgi:hypothetical protein